MTAFHEHERSWMTVREVADYWGVSDDKVRASIKKGALPAHVIDGCIRIDQRDAMAYGQHKAPTSTSSTS